MQNARGARRRRARLEDDDSEAQLLRGLVTFRQHAATERGLGEGGVGGGFGATAKQFNTPARSFDVEFARQLQSLQLLNSVAGGDGGGGGGGPDSPTPPTPPGADVRADMLVVAAEGQLRRGLRWRRRVTATPVNSLVLGSRPLLGYFQRPASPLGEATAGESPRRQQAAAVAEEGHPTAGGRLAYRKSIDGPGTQPDDEVERLLRSRSGTALVGWAGVGGGGGTPVAAASIVQVDSQGSTKAAGGATFVGGGGLVVRGETAAWMQSAGHTAFASAAAPVVVATPTRPRIFATAAASFIDEPAEADSAAGRGRRQGGLTTKRRKEKSRRRKVTGLKMLDSIDAKPQQLPLPPLLTPSSMPPPSPPTRRLAINSTKTAASSAISQQQATAATMAHSRTIAGSSDGNSHGHYSVGRERTCSSRDSRVRQSMERSGGWGAPSQAAAGSASDRASSSSSSSSKSFGLPLPINQDQQQMQHQMGPSAGDNVAAPPVKAAEADVATEASLPPLRLPVPDQYRVAHELARSANRNAQFAAWLRLGGAREPGDFFVGRTSVGAAYSYFPRLPRYNRGLRPWPDSGDDDPSAPPRQQYSGQMRALFYGRKRHTPAYLAYGDRHPDDYLPPPIIVADGGRMRRRCEPGGTAKQSGDLP